MIDDENLNPASTASEQQIAVLEKKIDDLKSKYILFFNGESKQPPEQERTDTEKAVRGLIYGGAKTARLSMIIQNLAARFSLYNNLWLKQLNELESGASRLQKKTKAPPAARSAPGAGPKKAGAEQEVFLSLNDEDSFENLVAACRRLLPPNRQAAQDNEQIINRMKSRMVTRNLVETKVRVALKNGKLNIALEE
jgi:hypothetical protein